MCLQFLIVCLTNCSTASFEVIISTEVLGLDMYISSWDLRLPHCLTISLYENMGWTKTYFTFESGSPGFDHISLWDLGFLNHEYFSFWEWCLNKWYDLFIRIRVWQFISSYFKCLWLLIVVRLRVLPAPRRLEERL